MTSNKYDTIIIGAGKNDLTPSPSPTGRGVHPQKKQSPRFLNKGL